MSRLRRRPVLAVATVLALLGLGAGSAVVLSDALGIRSTETIGIPQENPVAAAPQPVVAPPVFTVTAESSLRMDTAVAELTNAVDAAGGTQGEASLVVAHGDGDPDDDTYSLTGTPVAMRIDAVSEAGAARGVYDLAAAVRDGREVTSALGTTVSSRLPFRMVDLGAAGVDPDPEQWTAGDDYSHNSKAFQRAILADAPYVDVQALAELRPGFEEYVRHVVAEGATAIAVPGFLEYVTFDSLGVYPSSDPHPERAAAMIESFGPLWQYASDLGLDVYLRTDMLALTPPLERYLVDRFGGLDTENPELWEVYASGFDELAETMPYLDGTVIRIGEAGSVYDLPGWDYTSALEVTTVDAVRAMLSVFTDHAERAGTEVVFRTWSVGVGDVGDMHTDAASYHAVLDGLDSPALVVSTKFVLGDFYSHLPLNDTLEIGDQRRIVEFQSRREFENFGAFPNDLGELYRQAFERLLSANPRIEGVWVWTQDGGPWRAGPMMLELTSGFWQLPELNTELALRLARDPSLDPAQITADWARRWFSDDPATVAAIGEAMALSRSAIVDGLYIGPFADRTVQAIGLNPPPMMWLFEWDILTGDSAVLDVIYAISRDDLDRAIGEGRDALATVERMRELVAGTDPGTWRDSALRDEFLTTLDYQSSMYTVLAAYREMALRGAQWHDTLDPAALEAWSSARDGFEVAATEHLADFGGDVLHPPLNLTAADLGVQRADRDPAMAWAARVLLALVAAWIVAGLVADVRDRRGRGTPAALAAPRATWVAATRPWRAVEAMARLSPGQRVAVLLVPAVAIVVGRGIHSWFLAPAHLLVTLGSWLVFALVAVLVARRAGWAIVAAVGGVGMLRTALLMAADAPSGPGGYWFGFWTDEVARSLYVTLAMALLIWLVAAAGWAAAAVVGARRATGAALLGVGAVLAGVGTLLAVVGLETALTVWNDQLGLLPWGLSRILGITVYLEIPAETPLVVAALGVVLVVVGAVLVLVRRRRADAATAA